MLCYNITRRIAASYRPGTVIENHSQRLFEPLGHGLNGLGRTVYIVQPSAGPIRAYRDDQLYQAAVDLLPPELTRAIGWRRAAEQIRAACIAAGPIPWHDPTDPPARPGRPYIPTAGRRRPPLR